MKEEKSTVESNDSKQLNRISSKTKSEKPFYKKSLVLDCYSCNYCYW